MRRTSECSQFINAGTGDFYTTMHSHALSTQTTLTPGAGEFGLALEMSTRLEDLAGNIHTRPSLGEAIAEAAPFTLRNQDHAQQGYYHSTARI